MTHFIGAVVVPAAIEVGLDSKPTLHPLLYGKDALETDARPTLDGYLNGALAKFDENKSVPRWIPFEETVAKARESIERYRNGTYAEYLKNPVAYAKDVNNPPHLYYLAVEFPKKLTSWTDDEIWEDKMKWYKDDTSTDEEGNSFLTVDSENKRQYSTYNPDSTWDWWTIGGRWEETYRERQGETIESFRKELEEAKLNRTIPAEVEKLQEAYYEIERVRDLMKLKQATWEDLDAAEAKKLESKAYLPWWFPKNIVVGSGDDAQWIKQGDVGWWGSFNSNGSEDEWIDTLLAITEDLDPHAKLIFIDFHI